MFFGTDEYKEVPIPAKIANLKYILGTSDSSPYRVGCLFVCMYGRLAMPCRIYGRQPTSFYC